MNNMWWDKLVNMWWEGEPKKEDLVEYLADDDILDPANPKLKIYYEKKYEVVNKIKPKVMMEIGVRAGYSSFAFLSAAPKAKLYAIDVNKYIPDRTQIEEGGVSNVITMYGGIPDVFIDVAPKILSGFDVKFIEANSQEYTELPYDVDFIHIDGDHSYSGVMHDLNISKNHAEWMLVDDYDYIPRIKKAVDKFLSDNPDFTYEYIDDGFRGNMLIHTSFRRQENIKYPKVIINLPNCELPKFQSQKQEVMNTWVPLIEQKGFPVICSIADPSMQEDYMLDENNLFCKCTDELNENFTLKRYYFIKWAIETNQEFDYLFLTSNDTFVHPDRFYNLIEEYMTNPDIDAAGFTASFPVSISDIPSVRGTYDGLPDHPKWDLNENIQEFLNMKSDTSYWITGGSGYILSKKAASIIVDNYDIHKFNYFNVEMQSGDIQLSSDDFIFSNILLENGIKLYHDNRIIASSTQVIGWKNPSKSELPYIGDKDSFLAVQHPLTGDMKHIVDTLELKEMGKNIDKKFLIISSFYNNTKDHIKQTFDNVINQTYKNWLFVVTDDFSENDCKKLLQEEIKKRNHPNIIYYEEKYKREIYLYQNFFKGINYDYYLDISSDDILYSNMLEIYNYHFEKYPEVFSIFCDYTVVDENGRRERISVVKTSDDYIEEFKERTHPNQGGINGSYWHIWSKYHSWNMYGIGMCFRKSKRDKFLIELNCRSSTDSILFFNTLSEGNHLNIPRNLYTLVNRPNSDSSGMSSDEFSSYNSNALLAIDEYSKTLEFGSVKVYDDVWLETNALSNAEFVEYVDDINLITDIDELQLDKIRDLYRGKNISVNDKTKQNWIIIWNKLNEDQRIKMLKALQNYDGNFLIYNFLDDFNVLEDDIQKYFEDETTSFIEDVSEYETNFKWFSYFRHIIITRRN